MYKKLLICIMAITVVGCEKFDFYNCTPNSEIPVTHLIPREKAIRISQAVCNTLNNNKLIGIQISIRDSLNEDWNISVGAVDLNQNIVIENNHILRIGSVTKIFTATLILKLIEQNHLQIDQRISDFYPGNENIQEITIRHLLNHSSGIRDVFSIPSIFTSASQFPDKQWDANHLADVCMNKKLEFTPGTQHAYSNTNYLILGKIAEKATGKKIGQLFADYILDPVNLNNTCLVPYMDTPPELVNGYVHHFALSLKEWYTTEPGNTAWSTIAFSAGAMASNAKDLSAFMYHLFNGNIINRESLELMTAFEGNHGLGLFRIKVNERYFWGHEGEITGFESIAVFNPETRTIISICSNTTPFNINDLLNIIDTEL